MALKIGITVQVHNPMSPIKLEGEVVEISDRPFQQHERRTTRYRVMPTNTGTYFIDSYNVIDWVPGQPLWFDRNELRQQRRA